jgi:hypothetical protein
VSSAKLDDVYIFNKGRKQIRRKIVERVKNKDVDGKIFEDNLLF